MRLSRRSTASRSSRDAGDEVLHLHARGDEGIFLGPVLGGAGGQAPRGVLAPGGGAARGGHQAVRGGVAHDLREVLLHVPLEVLGEERHLARELHVAEWSRRRGRRPRRAPRGAAAGRARCAPRGRARPPRAAGSTSPVVCTVSATGDGADAEQRPSCRRSAPGARGRAARAPVRRLMARAASGAEAGRSRLEARGAAPPRPA